MYMAGFSYVYLPMRKLLTAYVAVSMLVGAATICALAVCWKNFNRGLKPHLLAPRRAFEQAIQHKEKSLAAMLQDDGHDELPITDLILGRSAEKENATSSSLAASGVANTSNGTGSTSPSNESQTPAHGAASTTSTSRVVHRRTSSSTDAIEPV